MKVEQLHIEKVMGSKKSKKALVQWGNERGYGCEKDAYKKTIAAINDEQKI